MPGLLNKDEIHDRKATKPNDFLSELCKSYASYSYIF